MSKKIPFLQMFAALRRWTELSNAAEGWLIVSAAIDKASRSARITVEGAAGAGSNLLREVEETLGRCYGLSSVKLEPITEKPAQESASPAQAEQAPQAAAEGVQETASKRVEDTAPQDAFARAEAIRRAALRGAARPAAPKGEKKFGLSYARYY